ncbi:sensor histidine kinase/response regulator [Caballeronia glathei]|jgi:signal transduction histidine kinase/ActR/RegA family two-component response regulator|uniref:Virulence sensor protein BvgS n=1 Tax=Caballeronia glathei TaxID=60547 RepID=A0A069PDN8_9BURK|nr:ATP-binding protein [Caballeronia glathei]KDR37929.1 histidine kinase [Caballeronia glathei]CDY76077.1 sensor histidine kinase/response regulator [Caballeronia glathei]
MAGESAHSQVARPWLRRLWYAALIALAIAPPIGAVAYMLYSGLLAKQTPHQVVVPYDGFYWDAAQLEIAYERFANQVLLYRSGIDEAADQVRLRFEILESKLSVVSASTDMLSGHDALRARQREIVRQLGSALASIAPELDLLEEDRQRTLRITGVLRQNLAVVTELSNGRRLVDVADRESIVRDFDVKRRYLIYGGILLALLSAAATALLLLNGYRRTRLIEQQRAALEAEHQATRAAREASVAKDTFLGMISHELRTPLHAIVSSVELLGLNLHAEADRRIIQRLETGARHLEAQMRDLTDYARLGAGKLELRKTVFDPVELLDSIIDANTPAATTRGLELRGEFVGRREPLESDQHRLRQIATNLVTNAIKYTDAGSIDVRFERSDDRLDVSVIDTGPGIAREQLPLIFEEFTQLDSSSTRRFDGAGMGLAVVRGLVDLLGGRIEVSSEVGQGAAFRVSLPVAQAADLPERREQGAQAAPLRKSRVLVIDDHESIRDSLTEMLTHLGYSAVAIGDVDSALLWLASNEADVILADLHMPGKDGYSFANEYRVRLAPGASVPIIAVSAYAPEMVDPGAAILFFDYLLKPVRYEVLRSAVARAVSVTRRQ